MIASLNTWARPSCPSAPSRAPIREPCGALDRPFPGEVPHAHKRKVSDIRLKPARDDKKQAHLKVRPFKTLAETGFFSSLSSRFPERSPNAALNRCSTLYTKSETSLARPTVVPSGPRLRFRREHLQVAVVEIQSLIERLDPQAFVLA